MLKTKGTEIGSEPGKESIPGIEKFFDILEEVKKEEQTTIETLFEVLKNER